MRRLLGLKSTRAALIVAALVGIGLCFSPLLGAPGIESALVLALVLPPFCAAIGARFVDAIRRDEAELDALRLLGDAVSGALIVLAVPTALLLLNTLRVPVCGPLEGLAFLVLGAGVSVVLAAVLGVLIGAAISWRRTATTIAALAPFALIGLGLYRFWATPAIFAYGHLVGYFPGTLYDPDITVTAEYLSFRVFSLFWLAAGVAAMVLLWDPARRRMRVRPDRWRLAAFTAALVAVGAAGEALGTELGHRSTAASITEALGTRMDAERCVAVVPREMPRADAWRLAEDCSLRVRQVEALLGVRQPVRVTAFFFRSADEKRLLMGASNTYIAKPWRNEVYLQVGQWPHPVLFHELVHVVAGNIGRGPFRVSGQLGGLLPSPAIIEGTAEAIAWEHGEGLTSHQWARAMVDEELAPPLASVEGLSFLLQPASRAYTVSGSFVRWIYETEGPRAVRRLYLAGNFEDALGRPLEEAEADWRRFLRDEVELPPEARALARLRFERPGIFSQICPHRIANLRAELGADLAAGDDRAAVGTCREILALDEGHASTRTALVGALARTGDAEAANEQLRTLIGPPSAAPPFIQRARLELGDAAWRRGESEAAGAIYRALAEEPMTDEEVRQLDVRRIALEMGGAGEAALRGLLAPRRDANADPAIAMSHIAALERVREDGLAPYLEARQLLFRQRFALALPRVLEARRRGLPSETLDREARRMEAMARYGVGHLDASAAVWRSILRDPRSREGDRVEARDWLMRIRLAAPSHDASD